MRGPFDNREYPEDVHEFTVPGLPWRERIEAFFSVLDGFASPQESSDARRYLQGNPRTGQEFNDDFAQATVDAMAEVEKRVNERLPAGRVAHWWGKGFRVSEADNRREVLERGYPGHRR